MTLILEPYALQAARRPESGQHYAREWLLDIEDISELVHQQRSAKPSDLYEKLEIPYETVYPVADSRIATKLGLSITTQA